MHLQERGARVSQASPNKRARVTELTLWADVLIAEMPLGTVRADWDRREGDGSKHATNRLE